MTYIQQIKRIGSYSKLASILFGLSLLITLATGYIWWTRVQNSPYRVFWDTVDKSLTSAGVTRSVVQSDNGSNIDQRQRLSLGAQNLVQGKTAIKQPGDTATNVVTESISTPTADYVRYISIETPQKSTTGGALDFGQVQNVWAKNDSVGSENSSSAFNEALFGIVPIVQVSTPERKEIVRQMKSSNVYQPAFDKVSIKHVDGRRVFEYTVKVNPKSYVTMLQQLVKAVGVSEPNGLDPSAYDAAPSVDMIFQIDPLARQLRSISYTTSSRVEKYSDYGVIPNLELPQETISFTELQERLQSVQ